MQPTSSDSHSTETPVRAVSLPRVFACAVLIVLAGAAAYSNSFRGQYVVDDEGSIVDNPSIRSLTPIWPVLTSATFCTVTGRPLLNLSLAINYALDGTDVWGYHAVNLVLHLLAALVLFGVVRQTLLLPQMADHLRRHATGLALASALIWTVHPLQTESVTYIVQRAESLVGLCYLFTLYATIRADRGRHPVGWSIASVISCFLGMASKEVMVTAPLVVLLYDRIFLTGSFAETVRRRWGLYLGLVAAWPFLAVLMLSSAGRDSTAGFGYGMSSIDYAMTQFGAIVGYLRLCFVPRPLILDYGAYVARSPSEIVPYAAIVLVLLAGALWALRRHPGIGFLALSFFMILAPTSSIVPLVTQTIAEHRMYLPLAPLVVLVVIGAWEVWCLLLRRWDTAPDRATSGLRVIPAAAVLIAVGALGYLTFERNRDYHSYLGILRDNAHKNPTNPRTHVAIASELLRDHEPVDAIAECDLAISFDPHSCTAYLTRGNAWADRKEYDRALADYSRSIELQPNYVLAHHNRANLNAELGRTDEALRDYTQAVTLEPRRAESWFERGALQKRLGRLEEAAADFSTAIRWNPVYPEAYDLRGHCEKLLGRTELALRDYDRAIEQRPNFADALNNRGALYGELDRPEKAIADFTRVIALTPDFAPAYKNRAICHYDLRQFDQAWADVRMFEERGGTPNPEFIRHLTEASGGAR